ncbi:MAG: hypothetical protein JO225_02560 [Candidatus Eremiobacteraeota bacterium]|nr:hypothetical protein [Candidatus Eremiobacteraeota bacterium]
MLHAAHPPVPVVVRAVVVSGDRQHARAYAAGSSKTYVAEFAQPLVVRVVGGSAPVGSTRHVRFHCIGCTFPPTEEKDEVKRVDPSTWSSPIEEGQADVQVIVQGAGAPPFAYTIIAEPVAGRGERATATTFTVFTR